MEPASTEQSGNHNGNDSSTLAGRPACKGARAVGVQCCKHSRNLAVSPRVQRCSFYAIAPPLHTYLTDLRRVTKTCATVEIPALRAPTGTPCHVPDGEYSRSDSTVAKVRHSKVQEDKFKSALGIGKAR